MRVRRFIISGAALALSLLALCGCQSISRERADTHLPPRTVLFTFDDGPNARDHTTARLLDVLRRERIKAAFCLLGENVERQPALVRRIAADGHLIINHGYSDLSALFMMPGEYRENLRRGEQAIIAALGHPLTVKLYRPHGGGYQAWQERIWQQEGYALAPVTVRPFDAVRPPSERDAITAQILVGIERQRGGIILLHDGHDGQEWMDFQLKKNPENSYNRAWVPAATAELIRELRRRGYRLDDFDLVTALKK